MFRKGHDSGHDLSTSHWCVKAWPSSSLERTKLVSADEAQPLLRYSIVQGAFRPRDFICRQFRHDFHIRSSLFRFITFSWDSVLLPLRANCKVVSLAAAFFRERFCAHYNISHSLYHIVLEYTPVVAIFSLFPKFFVLHGVQCVTPKYTSIFSLHFPEYQHDYA